MADTPAPPPTSQWTVRVTYDSDGILCDYEIESDEATLILDRCRGDIDAAAHRIAAALNGGPDVEALRSVVDNLWDRLPARLTEYGTGRRDVLEEVRAALVREQTGGTNDG